VRLLAASTAGGSGKHGHPLNPGVFGEQIPGGVPLPPGRLRMIAKKIRRDGRDLRAIPPES